MYYCRKFGIQEHLQKIGLEISEDTFRMQLLGKVNYVLQLHPEDQDMLDALLTEENKDTEGCKESLVNNFSRLKCMFSEGSGRTF